ncbi:nucleoside triphosphate pyrophosphohydrolase [Niabella yanshanensis]|uniref:Nucleoside triphosphate pyrophosphohydrolase n=1 Tax=Niabella yanshanensis TaxID=577386 RepID=A0ABZ0W8S3_9BACT|nr:nucleoside triphosphate pyrophosphohydrolase [Niabella yanshanensis]WQD38456.1 nucleoside triphosphate pyrophosphohydrolase [Niabella yanshanensis]
MIQNTFERLVTIMETLREKCPWDKKQTIQSLRQMTLEETYELTDAILDEDWTNIKEELGDLLLHIVFYSKIAAEQKHFTIDDVVNAISDKLIKRHPHIYPSEEQTEGLLEVKSEEDVKRNWERIKLKEGKTSVLSGVPTSLPSIIKAMRLQEKAKQVGFEWEKKEEVWEKVEEEMGELQDAVNGKESQLRQEEELGDLLFSIINYARFLNIDADAALEHTNKKFKSRFTQMEAIAAGSGQSLNSMTLAEMDAIWNSVKNAKPDNE